MATEKPIGSSVHRFVGVKDMASGGEDERVEASTSEVRNRSKTHMALLSTHKNFRRPRCAACGRRAEGGFPTRQLAPSRYPSTHLRLPLETSGGVGTAEPNTTALSLAPFAAAQSSELDAQIAEPSPCPLDVAFPRRAVPALRSCDLGRGTLQQRSWRAQVQPPERDLGRDRRVDLALRQLRIFPPRIPFASATGTDNSRNSRSCGVLSLGNAAPRTGRARSRISGPRNNA
jgi:hypothetical protein